MKMIFHRQRQYHSTFGRHEPVLKLMSGQSVRVAVPDCDGIGPDGQMLSSDRFECPSDCNFMIANPCAGPFYVENAEPGDTIAVNIEAICIDRDFGRTGISAQQIQVPQRLFMTDQDKDLNVIVPKHISFWKIDHKNNLAILQLEKSSVKQIKVPLKPFMGCVAVAPPNSQIIHSLHCGCFGGNLDIPATGIGARIILPVFVHGGLVFLGDIHAAQGDGELIGGGIEVGGTITFSVELIKNGRFNWPRIETATEIGTVGTGSHITEAMEIAFAQLVLCLTNNYGFDRWEAMHLVSQTAHARPGNFKSAFCCIDRCYLH